MAGLSEEKLTDRKLMIYFTAGIDDDGKVINKTKTFNSVRLDSEESDLASFAGKYSVLTEHTFKNARVADYFELSLSEDTI